MRNELLLGAKQMQPKTYKDIFRRTDAKSGRWACTEDYAIKFATMMLVFEMDSIRQAQKWCDAGQFVQDYLKQFYRSNTAQDALINPTKGECNMVLGKNREERLHNIKAWEDALKRQEQEIIARVFKKVEEVKAFMLRTRPLKYTNKDLFENVMFRLAADEPHLNTKLCEKHVFQIVYGEKNNESH